MRLPSLVAFFAVAMSVSMPVAPVSAHAGGLNAEGCHTNRKTGKYHCHRGSVATSTARAFAAHSGLSFHTCAEARAAGVAPIRRGQPGYAKHLDRDGDGIACEPYRGR